MRTVHRILSLLLIVFTLYLGVTGSMIQLIDLRTLFTHAPATDPNMLAIREGLDGTSDFQVIGTADYTAPVLAANLDLTAAINRVAAAARPTLGEAPMQYIELRMLNGVPVGQVKSETRLLSYDASTAAFLNESKPPRAAGGTFGRSQRNYFKGLHRLTSIGEWTLWINILVGVSLCIMLATGMVMYFKLLGARHNQGKGGLFWSAGGTWRTLHRAISLLSAVFLLVVALSGSWLAVESLGRAFMGASERAAMARGVRFDDPGAPLSDNELPAMLATTLDAYHESYGDTPARVVRLRIYGGMPQGIIVSGEEEAHQLVFNASNGRRVTTTEPGYPPQHFPFGWEIHQIAKQVHRGDIIGLTGRWMDLFAGFSLIFLTVSGAYMYFDLWRQRRKAGRPKLLWK